MARLVRDSNVYHNNGDNSTAFVHSKLFTSKNPYRKSSVHIAFGSNVLHNSSASYANSEGQKYRKKIYNDLNLAKQIVKTEKTNLRHAPSGKVVGKTNKVTFNDGTVRYFNDDELSTGHLKDF